jgi:hypothetical protein
MSAVMQTSRIGRRLVIDSVVASALLFGTLGPVYAEPPAVSLIGHYSNLVWTKDEDPHALSGYNLDLYRQGNTVFGNIGVAVGSPEPVLAKLYDISFDEKTKAISFKAKYSKGTRYHKDIPPEKSDAKVILTFSGKLSPRWAKGEFVQQDGYPPFEITAKDKGTLRKTSDTLKPDSIEEWNQLFGN